MTQANQLMSPSEAMSHLLAAIEPVDTEVVSLPEAAGRVLGRAVTADRPSPPCDVSAMDGYAVRLADLAIQPLPVAGESAIGRAPREAPAGQCVRLFTGAAVPAWADAVIPREDVDESPQAIRLKIAASQIKAGQHIRRRGENLAEGQVVASAGTLIGPAVAAALSTFGAARPHVHRRVRVAILTTGDELVSADAAVNPWQIRDANGPALLAMLSSHPWLDIVRTGHLADDLHEVRRGVADALDHCDALILTGGVSMGDHDHVPDAVREACGPDRILFHKLAIRPGKPVLAAIGPRGQVILGLPGNPVSVMVTARRLMAPALARRAGRLALPEADARVTITNPDDAILRLTWFRPVHRLDDHRAALLPTRGSGDIPAAAASDGFVEVPPGATATGPLPFYRWEFA